MLFWSPRQVLVAVMAFAVGSFGLVAVIDRHRASGADEARERLIVVLREQVSDPRTVAREQAREVNGRVRAVFERALKGYSVEVPPAVAARLARDPRVAYVERDQPVVTFASGSGVDRVEGDKVVNAGASYGGRGGVDIAIVDTGIAPHPDLTVVGGANCTTFTSSGQCQEGGFGDGHGHGTHVAGIAAARGGVTGVAPGARLYAVKALSDRGTGTLSSIIAAVDWLTARASIIEVANLSVGCDCFSQAVTDAINRSTDAGLVYVAAAGNDSRDAVNFSPANHPRVIAVSAMSDFDGRAGGSAPATCRSDVDDTFADFSNFGAVVDVVAPGVCINSTSTNGGYMLRSGTSMASPHVAGAVAIYVSRAWLRPSPSRWSQVLEGLRQAWTVAQTDPCGFTAGRSSEPMLMMASCDRVDSATAATLPGTSTTTTTTTPGATTTTTPATTTTTSPPAATTTTVGSPTSTLRPPRPDRPPR